MRVCSLLLEGQGRRSVWNAYNLRACVLTVIFAVRVQAILMVELTVQMHADDACCQGLRRITQSSHMPHSFSAFTKKTQGFVTL